MEDVISYKNKGFASNNIFNYKTKMDLTSIKLIDAMLLDL